MRQHHLNKYISKHQADFKAGYSTKDHLFQRTNDTINNFNKYEFTEAVMFDLEKAFDRIWHGGLIYNQINLPETLINWVINFITNRIFFVNYIINQRQKHN